MTVTSTFTLITNRKCRASSITKIYLTKRKNIPSTSKNDDDYDEVSVDYDNHLCNHFQTICCFTMTTCITSYIDKNTKTITKTISI